LFFVYRALSAFEIALPCLTSCPHKLFSASFCRQIPGVRQPCKHPAKLVKIHTPLLDNPREPATYSRSNPTLHSTSRIFPNTYVFSPITVVKSRISRRLAPLSSTGKLQRAHLILIHEPLIAAQLYTSSFTLSPRLSQSR
jgi:hypothetical protein